jgi:hypothetical protein
MENPDAEFSLEHLHSMLKYATERYEHYGIEIEVIKQKIEYLEERANDGCR